MDKCRLPDGLARPDGFASDLFVAHSFAGFAPEYSYAAEVIGRRCAADIAML
jgi:hypothetical protein